MSAALGTFAGRYVLADPPEVEDIALVIPGPLQMAILSILWRNERSKLNELWRGVQNDYKHVALSSISTTVTRLVRRGWIERSTPGYYRAKITRQELIDRIAEYIEQA